MIKGTSLLSHEEIKKIKKSIDKNGNCVNPIHRCYGMCPICVSKNPTFRLVSCSVRLQSCIERREMEDKKLPLTPQQELELLEEQAKNLDENYSALTEEKTGLQEKMYLLIQEIFALGQRINRLKKEMGK